jgi:hypothetical protein
MLRATILIPVTRFLLSYSLASHLGLVATAYQQRFISTTSRQELRVGTATSRCFSSMSMANLVAGSKFDSPSAERNKDPIWQVIEDKIIPVLKQQNDPSILEIAAGAGVHTHYFTKNLIDKSLDKPFQWYPADADENCLPSILAYVADELELVKSNVVQPPTKLTLVKTGILEQETSRIYENIQFDLILNINMIHISPWTATEGLMKLAAEKLRNNTGLLFLYGPFKVGGTYCESNR